MRDSLKKWSKRYAVHLTAIFVMIVLAVGVGGYILSNQRFYLPVWVPVIGTDFYTVYGEFETAQAVMPGQGQTVNIAGVKVGEIGNVSLKDGRAIVEMKIRRAYAPIYRDATLWIRPKTPLNDMYIDLSPGHSTKAAYREGETVPLANTKPTVNFDEFLSMLDADTRNYLQLLLNGAGEGLDGRGEDLRAGFKRFAPTGKYGVEIVKELQKRRHNIKRAINNLSLLARELGENSDQFASLIDSSSTTLQTWASEQESIRQLIAKSPAALGETADAAQTAQQVVADSTIAFRDLQPLAREMGVALKSLKPFFRDQTAVTRDQFRPFAREAQSLLNTAAPASSDLAKAMPEATRATKSFNKLLSIVAYNPAGSEEGYLYWLAWFNHVTASQFSMQDANGPVRSGGILGNDCQYSTAKSLKNNPVYPVLKLAATLAGIPDPKGVCS